MKKNKNAQKNKKYDVCLIRFEKTANCFDKGNKVTPQSPDYICLGHFDRVTVEPLTNQSYSNMSPLQVIGKNIKNNSHIDDNHIFSLYLLRETGAASDCSNFWNINANYCSIIRLHCDLTKIGEVDEPIITQLESYFSNLNDSSVKYVQLGLLRVGIFDISYIIYDSLELGDAVVVLKSNSIVAMLEVARCLNFNCVVRDTYTYCLIHTSLLEQASSEETHKPSERSVTDNAQQKNNSENVPTTDLQSVVQQPMLNYAATRFAIRDAYAADQFLSDIGIQTNQTLNYPKAYFITGTTDLIVEWGQCTENVFVQHIKKIAKKGIFPNTTDTDEHQLTIQTAFSDVITRIGINYINKPLPDKADSTGAPSSEEKKKTNIPTCPSEITFCFDTLTLPSFLPFRHSFSRILGTLESMYHNSVTDDLYNLLYPSTRAMVKRLACIEEVDIRDGQLEQFRLDIIRYLETWELLAGDITNLESQLVHHPELQVVRYYTPAMVLQFELEFAILCSKLLSDRNSRCFIPMLAMSQNTTVSTQCLLDPLDGKYNGECALITQIPSEMLYNPWKVAHQLCHEVSHYSGDTARNRNRRKNVLCKCMADWIIRYWSEPYIKNIPGIRDKYLTDFKEFCDRFKERLYKIMSQNLRKSTDDYHLEKLREITLVFCQDICSNSQLREQFESRALSYASTDEQLAFLGKQASAINETHQLRRLELDALEQHLDYLQSCLKEGYADISMIMLLDCSDDSYIECVYAEEIKRVRQEIGDIDRERLYNTLNPHVDRFALVYAALKNKGISKLEEQTKSENEWLKKAIKKANHALSAIQGNTEVYWEPDDVKLIADHLRMPEATAIINYFADCIRNLQNFLKIKEKQGDIYQLRKVLKAVSLDCFDWSELQAFLFQARKHRKEEYQKEADEKASLADSK